MAVLPRLQRCEIGSRLGREGLVECARMGYQAVVVVGHPWFYPRLGFRPGRDYGLRCNFDVPVEVFMVAVLAPGALSGVSGKVRYAAQFGGS
jgi:putative acetyltransferase